MSWITFYMRIFIWRLKGYKVTITHCDTEEEAIAYLKQFIKE